MYLRQEWRDIRLTGITDKRLRLSGRHKSKMWLPDTYFNNEKRAGFHEVTVNNFMLYLNSSGFLWYVAKISATLSCTMNLKHYPMDLQRCPMSFESFGYTMDILFFAWLDSPVDIDGQLQLPQFSLRDSLLYDCSQNYTTGAYPCLEIRFIFQREIGYFLIQLYIPCILIVVLSWVAFWINLNAIPARVMLGLYTVLAMTTQSTGIGKSLPRVSYVKAIDVWMSSCLVFVFASLIEFAIVNVVSRKVVPTIKPNRRAPSSRMKDFAMDESRAADQLRMSIMGPGLLGKREASKRVDPSSISRAMAVDKVARKGFPAAFLLFNILYWIWFTMPQPILNE